MGTGAAPGAVNILLVDDRPEKLLALESVIHDLGRIVKANSGAEALKALLNEDFAVILLDVNMPNMDGFETASLIRQRRRSEKTPIIFFTALDATETHVTRGYSLGAVDYIRVPAEPEALRAKVAAFVDLHNKTERVKQQAEELRRLQEREHERLMAEAADRLEVETRRNRFFTLAVDMLAIAGYDGHFKQLNPSWRRVLGFSDEQLKSQPLLELVHEEDREATAEQWRRLTGGATIAYFENRYRTREGTWRWLGWTAAPFAEEGLVYIFARDITELKAAEEARVVLAREQAARQTAEAAERRAAFLSEAGMALAASALDYRATLRQLVHLALPELGDCCLVDVREEDGRIERVEAAHADPERLEAARELLPFAPRAGARSPATRVLDTGEPVLIPEVAEDDLRALADGDERHAQALAALRIRSLMTVPLVARGRVLGVFTCLVTTPSRRFGRLDLELAQELGRRAALAADNAWLYQTSQEARTAAEQANRAKDEFLATLSHELRTPLTPILGWTVMLRGGRMDPATVTRGLEVIERNVRAQAQLIEDLLDVSRIITGKLRVDLRPTDVAPVVEAGLDAVRPSAEAKEIRLQVDLPPAGVRVLGDPDRLQQVVWNLASNAVKFTPKGGAVQVRLRALRSHAELSVTDSGRGISPEFLPYVFERFRQADSTSTRKFGGLGLGLAIVRHLVELHGGTVHAESTGAEQGATFTVQLPLLAADASSSTTRPDGGGEESGVAEPARLAGVRVAVVDDENDMREFLSVSLRGYGAEVIALGSAEEALLAVQERRPDVLVSDIGMPGDDGYALIRRLRALPADRGGLLPAVALTAFAQGEDGSRILAAGYQVHLPKPVEPSRLASVVARLAAPVEPAGRSLPLLG